MNDESERILKEVVVTYLRYYTSICTEGLKKKRKPSVRIACAPAKIQVEYSTPSNKSQDCYHYVNPFSDGDSDDKIFILALSHVLT
jgi:hypothetical protein